MDLLQDRTNAEHIPIIFQLPCARLTLVAQQKLQCGLEGLLKNMIGRMMGEGMEATILCSVSFQPT